MNIINKIMVALKVEDGSKGRMYKRLQATGAAPICKRCGGSGKYAYNLMDGTTCYGCSGSGVIWNKSYDELLEVVQSQETQNKLNTYLAELEAKKQPKQKVIAQPTQPKEISNTDLVNEMFKDALERQDWEFVVRIMIKQKEKGFNIVEGNKPATEKQINFIKSLIKKKTAKQQSDKDDLTQLVDNYEKGNQTINHTEVNYIINWLTEK